MKFRRGEQIDDRILKTDEMPYLGWVEGNSVWRADGEFLSEIVDEHYIMKQIGRVKPVPRVPRVPPVPPIPQVPQVDRTGRVRLAGSVDALDDFD